MYVVICDVTVPRLRQTPGVIHQESKTGKDRLLGPTFRTAAMFGYK